MAAGIPAEGGGLPSEKVSGLKSERSPTQDGDHLNGKPNIVFILMDNLAYGELGVYGGGALRGAATPRIDGLAAEGLRLQNFNVEPSCTPSRSAIMTGRFPIRSGTYSVIEIGHKDQDQRSMGLVQWEVTIAELLSQQGYATAAFGKWHLGLSEGRYPTNQGFDEWYGIPDSGNMSFWPQEPYFDKSIAEFEYVMEARKGEKARQVKVFDEEARRSIDLELTQQTIEFMDRSVKNSKPFYAYVPLTQVHLPTLPSRRFEGKTGNGDWADVLAQTDWIVGQILDAVDRLGVRDNTVFIFTSDNGAEDTFPWRGWSGPWTGSYVTAMEGSLRVPFIIRWPHKIPPGRVSNEIVHAVDTYTTLARMAGAQLPTDRIIDGVDQTDFFLGKQEKSNREWFPAYVGNELYAAKWRNWKLHLIWRERMGDPPQKLAMARLFNLFTNPQERPDDNLTESMQNTWIFGVIGDKIDGFLASLKEYPPVPYGASDPYIPPYTG
jgi:arylsulfatase